MVTHHYLISAMTEIKYVTWNKGHFFILLSQGGLAANVDKGIINLYVKSRGEKVLETQHNYKELKENYIYKLNSHLLELKVADLDDILFNNGTVCLD